MMFDASLWVTWPGSNTSRRNRFPLYSRFLWRCVMRLYIGRLTTTSTCRSRRSSSLSWRNLPFTPAIWRIIDHFQMFQKLPKNWFQNSLYCLHAVKRFYATPAVGWDALSLDRNGATPISDLLRAVDNSRFLLIGDRYGRPNTTFQRSVIIF